MTHQLLCPIRESMDSTSRDVCSKEVIKSVLLMRRDADLNDRSAGGRVQVFGASGRDNDRFAHANVTSPKSIVSVDCIVGRPSWSPTLGTLMVVNLRS